LGSTGLPMFGDLQSLCLPAAGGSAAAWWAAAAGAGEGVDALRINGMSWGQWSPSHQDGDD
jgi:hypothetical protein